MRMLFKKLLCGLFFSRMRMEYFGSWVGFYVRKCWYDIMQNVNDILWIKY